MPMLEHPDIFESMKRIMSIEIEACKEIGYNASASFVWNLIPEIGICWRNMLSSGGEGEEESEEYNRYDYEFTARLIVSASGGGAMGKTEEALFKIVPYFIASLNRRETLRCAAFPEPQKHLIWARCLSPAAQMQLNDTGSGGSPSLGSDFRIMLSFMVPKQVYSL